MICTVMVLSWAAASCCQLQPYFGTQRYVHSNYSWRAGSVLAFQEASAAGIVLYVYSIILHPQIKSIRVTSLYHVSSVVLL